MTSPSLQKYLIEDAVERIQKDYQSRGYQVSREVKVHDLSLDLVATKGPEEIVFEFKLSEPGNAPTKAVKKILEYVKQAPNRRLNMVFVTPPKERRVEILGLDATLTQYLINNFPSELDTLSTHTRIEEVGDIDINSVIWSDRGVCVEGMGNISVSLQLGSDSENVDVPETTAAFPFTFKVLLNPDRTLEDVEELTFDTSSYFE